MTVMAPTAKTDYWFVLVGHQQSNRSPFDVSIVIGQLMASV
jgi:predicted P-loop ATPase